MKKNVGILLKINALIIAIIIIAIVGSQSGLIKESKEKEEETSGALESMQWMSEMRMFPDKEIPAGAFDRAFEQSKQMPALQSDNPDAWTSIGPNNIGGRSLCLAIHPVDTSLLFIGSASGGLWKSTTGGLGANAWSLMNTGFPSSAVSSIVIDSLNPNVMYIGTGESYGYQYSSNGLNIRVTRGMYGIGILKTVNGGQTWVKSLDMPYQNQSGVWDIVYNPKNSNMVYTGTTEGIYKTYNAGGSWTQVLPYKMVMDLMINPIDTNILYASIGNLTDSSALPVAECGIFKSTNSGISWTKLTGNLPTQWSGKATLDMYKGNPNYLYASIPNQFAYVGYYRSTNAGVTWSLKNTTVAIGNQGWYNNGHIVKPDNSETMVVGTLNVAKSSDGGTTFTENSSWSAWYTGATPAGQPEGPTNFVHADVHNYAVNPKDANKLYALTDGGLYRSNTFGGTNSFYSCNGGYVTSQFYGGFVNSYQDSAWCLGGLQDNRSAFYQGTTSWYKTFVGDGAWCAVNSTNDNTCYTAYTYGDINKSVNRGVSWTDIAPPNSYDQNYFCFAAPYICCKSNPQILYAGGNGIYKSADAGTTWNGPYGSFGTGQKVLSLAVSEYTTDTLYCGTVPNANTTGNCYLYKSVNGGTAWTQMTGGSTSLPNRYPIDFCINPNNSKQVYVTYGGFGTGHIYKSTDGGVNFTNISGTLPDMPIHSVVVDPLYPNNVYCGNDIGVYVSTNGGTNWFTFSTGMPYTLIFDLTISYPNRKLRAATHGNGIWQTNLLANPVGINEITGEVPASYSLSQNYPNPFNPSTKIKFSIPSSSVILSRAKNLKTTLKIYDLLGKEIAALVNEQLQPGTYEVTFDAGKLSSGVYFYRLQSDSFVDVKRMTLLK